MAEWKEKDELIEKARLEDERDPQRNRRYGKNKNAEEKDREHPNRHEVTPGRIFGLYKFPKNGDWDSEWVKRDNFIWWNTDAMEFANNRGFWPPDKLFKVRIVCSPVKKSDICLVERISDGKLCVVPIKQLYFVNGRGI
jgi:hypothetical protein